MTQTVLL